MALIGQVNVGETVGGFVSCHELLKLQKCARLEMQNEALQSVGVFFLVTFSLLKYLQKPSLELLEQSC